MPDYKRISKTEWQWQQGAKHYAVRYFPGTGRLIWSGWVPTGEGSMFDEGIAQEVSDFLENGVTHHDPPPELLADLRTALQESQPKRRGLFGWLRRG